ncbi:hypothetical protein [Pseudomonas oryzihabitans]|uniref:hypothetical protein n=1 Tax=Pseudomonas oryzihabitans TaxID=47885 RepID=UPI003F9C09D0
METDNKTSDSLVQAASKQSFPLDVVVDCPIELLELDRNNPRLMTGTNYQLDSEIDLIKVICSISDVRELVISICDNGYLNLEPLIIYSETGTSPYQVLEGNRRLTAIKLIRSPELASAAGMNIPSVKPEVLRSTDQVKVFRVADPADARAFIGFKHINGPQRWDAYAKARFATDWYKSELENGVTIDDIATRLGDNHNTIRSIVSSLLLLDQAREEQVYSIDDRTNPGRFAFSHLYTALGRPEYRDFLGLELGWDKNPSASPVSSEKLEALGEMLTFVYGSKSSNVAAKVKSQNPDLKNLGKVLANDVALAKLRSGAALDIAFEETLPPSKVLADAMVAANLQLKRAIELASKVNPADINETTAAIAKEINAQARILSLFVNEVRSGDVAK